jgi:hypothetical protein
MKYRRVRIGLEVLLVANPEHIDKTAVSQFLEFSLHCLSLPKIPSAF